MKSAWPVALVCGALLLACAHAPEVAAKKPAVQAGVPFLIQPAELDIGVVAEGEKARARLFVRNTGRVPLHIANVNSPCGCTVSNLGSHEVPPGGFTTLDVVVDTTAKGGAVKKKVTVTDSFGRSADAWLILRVKENPHAGGMQGRGIFSGTCASCHAEPARGKTRGAEIYAVVCAMCHGKSAEGAYAPALRGRDARTVRDVLRHGISRRMPAFSRDKKGPLSDAQIDALAQWLARGISEGVSGLDE